MKNIKIPFQFLMYFLVITLVACDDKEEEMPLPPSNEVANFSYTFDPNEQNKVVFTADSNTDSWYTHWSFGDNTAAEGTQAEKIFYLAGEYEVRFKVFTDGGTAETTQIITIDEDISGGDLVENGTFEDESGWTILPISGGVEVTFENGAVTWMGGGWGHTGIYQTLEVEANTPYQIQLDVAGSGMSDGWFEVYVGTVVPMEGTDYTDGGIRLGLNTWDGCGGEAFDGPLTALSCSNGGGDGTFEFPTAVTAYLVIRSGGGELGTDGVKVDNVTVREL